MVYPTDTVYGLGTDARNREAVDNLFRAKNRAPDKPISIAVSSQEMISNLVHISRRYRNLVSRALPGPYTFILRSKPSFTHLSWNGRTGVRIPDHHLVADLSREFPITCTSANLSGQGEPREPGQITVNYDLLIDDGPAPSDRPSTVIDLSQREPKILREGAGPISIINRYI